MVWFLVADGTALLALRSALLSAGTPVRRVVVSTERQLTRPVGTYGSFCLLTERDEAPWSLGQLDAFAPAEGP